MSAGEPFFRIEMLPATNGDCLWVEYGKGGRTRRLLIDGGPLSTFDAVMQRIGRMPQGDRAFVLIVLTHVDRDHIDGLVRLFAERPLPFAVDRVWFNGWRQMRQAHGLLGANEGEFLSALLVRRAPRAWRPDDKPIVVESSKALPMTDLADGMKLTLLSPTPEKLDKMADVWESKIKDFNPGDLDAAWAKLAKKKKFLPGQGLLGAVPDLEALMQTQYLKDDAVPNGSSIAFLAEFERRSALFLADSHPEVVAASIKRLCEARGLSRLEVGAVKVSHHGSRRNTSPELLKLIASPKWLISTNGAEHEHPNKECIARIIEIAKPKQIVFNYATPFTEPWLTAEAQQTYGYEAVVRDEKELTHPVDVAPSEPAGEDRPATPAT